ncbi:MAG TPA: hypothetical protein PLG17_00625 [Thermodesulfobacteriota bacterium]|nr:hypothetical protein [Deltaproteobacteria bacterium]HNU70488.1 hypothetical protein [Thermodesulfobacteriota bacterium]HOC39016.1 hypothetical protein [Thermodesulfobacteriota bacterium]HQO76994.1 hypothetical protein [Thermodesulfobacteriota bacterium]
MTIWKCNHCNYLLEALAPPEQCPACSQKCTFIDVTCYTPECGGPDSGAVDPKLAYGSAEEK